MVIRRPERGGGEWLDVSLMHHRSRKLTLDNNVRLLETLLHVSLDGLNVSRDIALDAGVVASGEIPGAEHCGQVLVKDRSAVLHGFLNVEDRG